MADAPRVLYVGPFGMANGYARAGHDYLMALTQAGCEVSIRPQFANWQPDELKPTYEVLRDLVGRDIVPTHILVHSMPHVAPELLKQTQQSLGHELAGDAAAVCLTTWETDRMPDRLVKGLRDSFDRIVIPSMAVADALMHDEWSTQASLVPHCFDSEFWCDDGWSEAVIEQRDLDGYTFYAVGVWADRKNFIDLFLAYISEFTIEDEVNLGIITPAANYDALTALCQYSNLNPEKLPRYHIVDGKRLTMQMIREVHRASHCYVSTSRGEAWNLGCFEACLVGNATITPEFGGQEDYIKLLNGHHPTYGGTMTPALAAPQTQRKTIKIGKTTKTGKVLKRIEPHGIDATQMWFQPDLAALKKLMREAYENNAHQDHTTSTDSAAFMDELILKQSFSYDVVGKQFREVLEGV